MSAPGHLILGQNRSGPVRGESLGSSDHGGTKITQRRRFFRVHSRLRKSMSWPKKIYPDTVAIYPDTVAISLATLKSCLTWSIGPGIEAHEGYRPILASRSGEQPVRARFSFPDNVATVGVRIRRTLRNFKGLG